MAKFNLCQRLFIVQLICMTIFFKESKGIFNFKNVCKVAIRSLARIPSKLADGGQYATQKVAGTVGAVVKPITPLKKMVDATGGAVSNVMGTTSRLLGKPVEKPQDVMFLYTRSLNHLGTSKSYQKAVRTVLGHALYNVVLHNDEFMEAARTSTNLNNMPVLNSVVNKLRKAGATEKDIKTIVSVLGRNGKQDLPDEIQSEVLGILKDQKGKFKTDGPMTEIRWIAEHPHGFYRINDKERTDYKFKTIKKYSNFGET
ncbi:hypothetical protein AGLY_001831 [Aphis glycines]|uniref:Uncharacterized protein n=1 Tax=Aphis glycines TaxID=307491 RepID=A0A6G0U784_APHGL|nr:hypothetical protein AGLY_001831 [Aphis glycines]